MAEWLAEVFSPVVARPSTHGVDWEHAFPLGRDGDLVRAVDPSPRLHPNRYLGARGRFYGAAGRHARTSRINHHRLIPRRCKHQNRNRSSRW